MPSRRGYTLIEILVVIAIIGVLIAMLVPAVHKVREAANMVACSNNLHQLGVAVHNCHDTYRKMPPGIGWYPGETSPGAYGTVFFHLLPFVEQDPLYKSSYASGNYFAGNNAVFTKGIPVLRCPSDPSNNPGGIVPDNMGVLWGASSYAANAQIFTRVTAGGLLSNPQGYARILASFPDGASSTLMFVEKYARCTNANYPAGGNLWAYWITSGQVRPYHPGFAISWNGYSIGPGSRFQVQPRAFLGMCDPTVASSPHTGGIHVTMGDASVRFLSAAIPPNTWWYLCTPAGGETILQEF